jgi:hypothetical protein
VSYFFDRPTHLTDIEAPCRDERKQMWTSAQVEGRRYGAARPVIVLTSHATFSAGEDFAYSMQTTGRATVIGKPTRGGAHPVARYRLAAHFIGQIPVEQSISPITNTNWEGNGVQPDRASRPISHWAWQCGRCARRSRQSIRTRKNPPQRVDMAK